METRTVTYNVFQFDELSEDAKNKAREWARYFNVDFEDWYQDDYFFQRLIDAGLVFEFKDLNFDLDRRDLYFSKSLRVDDARKFLRSAGVDLRTKDARYILDYEGVTIRTQYFGGGSGKNCVDPSELPGVNLTDYLNSLLDDCLSDLRKAYYSSISDEAVDETIRANEYTFDIEGERKE